MDDKKRFNELYRLVRKYYVQGLGQTEIGKILGISRQRVHYWISVIRCGKPEGWDKD